jgi:S-adenosylmethionine:tRNA ribosyltransferase-isomerase
MKTDREMYPHLRVKPVLSRKRWTSFYDNSEVEGIGIDFYSLHVGIVTFRPVKVPNPADHEMHEESYSLSEKTVEEILGTKASGGRVIAVGTTTVRVLEHCSASGTLKPSSGKTKLLILPPYKFRTVDGLITNFHLPKSPSDAGQCSWRDKPVLHAIISC